METVVIFLSLFACTAHASSITSSHLLDPDYEMYSPIIRPWKLGLGFDPIEHYRFILDTEMNEILLPVSYVGEENCDSRDQFRYHEVYIDLGGPKPFFADGCSPYYNTGFLGLGRNSSIWGIFSGYENRGGRVELLGRDMPFRDINESTEAAVTDVISLADFKNSKYTYDARTGRISGITSYTARDGMSSTLSALFMLFIYIYLESKTKRRLVFADEQTVLSIVIRTLFALSNLALIPLILEYYETRELLRQDIGTIKSTIIVAMLYFCTALILVHQIMRLIIYGNSKYKHPSWIVRVDIMGNMVLTTVPVLGAWFAFLWVEQADSGHPVSLLILPILLFEQTVVLHISLCRLASKYSKDPWYWTAVWWILILLPVYGVTLWLVFSYGIYPYVQDAFVVGNFQIYITSFIVEVGIIYASTYTVNKGMHYITKRRRVRKKQ